MNTSSVLTANDVRSGAKDAWLAPAQSGGSENTATDYSTPIKQSCEGRRQESAPVVSSMNGKVVAKGVYIGMFGQK